MHETAAYSGEGMAITYGIPKGTVVDIGGQDVNGSLKQFFVKAGMRYICVDMVEHEGVDVVVQPGDPLPFANGSIDLIISSSCFEHDPCFWMTFREMARIVKLGGYVYVSAPANGPYHGYPGDNWRFYGDAGQALAHWAGREFEGKSFPMEVEETFHLLPHDPNKPGGYHAWVDFVCIWKRVPKAVEKIVDDERKNAVKKLEQYLQTVKGAKTMKMSK